MQYKQGKIMAYGQRGTKKAPPKRCFSKHANIMQLMQWGSIPCGKQLAHRAYLTRPP